MERFGSSTSAYIQNLACKSNNSNITKASNKWIGVFNTLANVKGSQMLIDCLFPAYLDIALQQLCAKVKNPNSLAAMSSLPFSKSSPPFLKIPHPPTLPTNRSSQVFLINGNATVKLRFDKYYSCKTTT